ncbi:MAG: FixH family protein [Desulfuromonadales bacterium]
MNKLWTTLALSLMTLLILANMVPAAQTRLSQSTETSAEVTVTFADAPLRTMTETPFLITITDASGQVVQDADLTIRLDMPAMPMPPNHPAATWRDGAYRGTAIFTMAGAWQMILEIKQPGEATQKIIFDIDRVLMK